MKKSKKVLVFVACVAFLAVIVSGIFLSSLGAHSNSHSDDDYTETAEVICSCPFVKVSLQPYADFSQKEAEQLKIDLEKHLCKLIAEVELDFEVLPNKPLGPELMNDAGTRYRADKILNTLTKDAGKQHVIIALTRKHPR